MLSLLNPFLKYIAGGLAIVCVVLGIALKLEQIHSAKLQTQVTNLSVQLERISTAKNDQKAVTQERIKVVEKRVHDADSTARKIETAKSPGNCKTPKEILDADL